jgi:hypothetical protein
MIVRNKCTKRVAFTKSTNIQRACAMIRCNSETGKMEIASFQKIAINDKEVETMIFHTLKNADKIVFCDTETVEGSIPLLFHIIITGEIECEQVKVSKSIISDIKNPRFIQSKIKFS